jgi:hypothetical protein
LREQPPSDSGALLASAFSHMLPGPPPNSAKCKIKTIHPPGRALSSERAGLHSRLIRNTVTYDSIAPISQPLIWGAFVRIHLALLVKAQPDWASSARIVLLNGRTACSALCAQALKKETPVNLIRARREIRKRFAERETSLCARICRAPAPIGHTRMRDRPRPLPGWLAVPSAPRKGTGFLAELPPVALSPGEHATTAFAGR